MKYGTDGDATSDTIHARFSFCEPFVNQGLFCVIE